MTNCVRLENLLDWFGELSDRAEVRGVLLERPNPDEVEEWGSRARLTQDELDHADELRTLLLLADPPMEFQHGR
jgi:hypothetical protein